MAISLVRGYPGFRKYFAALGLVIASVLAFCSASALATQPIYGAGYGGNVSQDGQSVVFRVYSSRATRIEVDLFTSGINTPSVAQYVLSPVPSAAGDWSISIPIAALTGAGFHVDSTKLFTDIYYGFRAWGPNWPYDATWNATSNPGAGFVSDVDSAGNRFNPNKLLIDPYGFEITQDRINSNSLDSSLFSTGNCLTACATADRLRDSALKMAKTPVAIPYGSGWSGLNTGTKPSRPYKDDIIYEVSVRGLTKGDASVSSCQGTYAGAAQKAAYLASMGINTIEFLPIHETENDGNDMDAPAYNRSSTSTAGDNYWGYMTTNFFAPERRYSCDQSIGGPTKEFAAMVKAFHDAGVKVVVDVVYNHTGEGGVWTAGDATKADLWSFRGLDNATYYLLTHDGTANDNKFFYDITGIGNTMNTHNTVVQNLIIDSLTHYNKVLGVDGFRFDLGMALGNINDNNTPISDTCRFRFSQTDSSTALAKVAAAFPGVFLSAEPWAAGGCSSEIYQLGNLPKGWSEWNGDFRDTVRKAQNMYGTGTSVANSNLATRVAGSSDYFGDDGRFPYNSVNFVNVHDGFTLKDLYSCSAKNNTQAWPAGPSDGGSNSEYNWDAGGVQALQRQQARMSFGLLMLSAGVPLFNGGDEFLRSLNCNNNAYNVDSSFNWLNWSLDSNQSTFQAFTQGMMKFRNAHPALRRSAFFTGTDSNGNGMKDIDWFNPSGAAMAPADWSAWPAMQWRIDGTEAGDVPILVMNNATPNSISFTLPGLGSTGITQWCRVTDTASWNEGTAPDLAAGSSATATCLNAGSTYGVNGRSLVLFVAKAVVDTTPDAFTLNAATGVATSTVVTSNTITVTGINAATPISITGGLYSINGGPYTSSPGTVNVGDTVNVQVTASAANSTAVSATLTIGGVSSTYTVTTAAAAPTLTLSATAPYTSRKVHGTVGAFDIPISATCSNPQRGIAVPVEPRNAFFGSHEIVFGFNSAPDQTMFPAANVTATVSGGGSLPVVVSFSGNEMLVTVGNSSTPVPNASRVTVSATGAGAAAGLSPSVVVGFLYGDVNNSCGVTSSDITPITVLSGQVTNSANYKYDVNTSGGITSSDIISVRVLAGSAL